MVTLQLARFLDGQMHFEAAEQSWLVKGLQHNTTLARQVMTI